MKKTFIGVTALALLISSSVLAKDNAPWLKSETTYNFVFGTAVRDTSWYLAWEGTIEGDVNGVMRWWVDVSESIPIDDGFVGRWEVLDCEPVVYPPINCPLEAATVIMAGYTAGASFNFVDGIAEYSGKGIVTFVSALYPEYDKWFGRRITEGGWFYFDSGGPTYGEGAFMIFDRPSNKH